MLTLDFDKIRLVGFFFRWNCPSCNHQNSQRKKPVVNELLVCEKCERKILLKEHRKNMPKGKTWTEEELKFFVKQYPNTSNQALANKMFDVFGVRRTKGAMENMRISLNKQGISLNKSKSFLDSQKRKQMQLRKGKVIQMAKEKRWLSGDDKTLKTLREKGYSWATIAKVMGRTKNSCQAREQRLKRENKWENI